MTVEAENPSQGVSSLEYLNCLCCRSPGSSRLTSLALAQLALGKCALIAQGRRCVQNL